MADQQHTDEHAVNAHTEVAGDHSAGHAEATGPFADPTLWATVAVFIFLGILVWKKVPAALNKSLDDRADRIKNELDNARLLREKAQAALADAERQQAEAEENAKEIVASAKREAQEFAKTSREDLKERMARREKMAEERIARAESEAMQQVRTAAADAAAAAAAKIIGEQTSAADGIFDNSLGEVKKALS